MIKTSELVQAHISSPAGMVFYPSLDSARSDIALLGYISVINRAWDEMNLDGVLCLDGRPVLYLKEFNRPFSPLERIQIQRRFWNQGVANILVLADPVTVYIYSGLAKPQKDETAEKEDAALVETLSQVEYVQGIQSFYHNLATGNYYETRSNYFDPNESVDSWLLDNLRSLRNALVEGDEKLEVKNAHAFIGRVLFLCYLLDRGIVSVDGIDAKRTGTTALADILESHNTHKSRINYLYDELFSDLKVRFNGNMFDQDLSAEKRLIRSYHLDKLTQFLGGHNVATGQRTLGFWPYDFKMIPVETISAIYQDFLATEDRTNQQKRGAFYTPRFLAEMVVDIAIRDNRNALNWRFLDPSCGSGIFLVILFNRLANNWIFSQSGTIHYARKANALQEILKNQIRGVDVEETACRIACFSLYLAYLDFFNPPDIQSYIEKTGKPLPNLLNYGDTPDRPGAVIPVIHKASFLDEKTLPNETFDCIVGNPPWQGRGSKQLALKFVQKAPQLLKNKGTGCLLLPSKIIQNQTDAFQADWLQQVTLERVFQLADYSFLLFQDALCPAIIVRFRNEPPNLLQSKVEFIAPKFNREGLRQGIVTVNPSARTWIPLADIFAATKTKTAPIVWKRHLWGTPRDQKLIQLLQSLPPLSDLAGKPKESKRWVKGQGFQPNTSGKSKKPKASWWKKSHLFIEARASCWDSKCIVLSSDDCEQIGNRFSSLHRLRDPRIFKGPMVLISQGFGKVAYSDFNVLFQHSLQSIAGPRKDAEYLKFLTAYLRSNLASYFLFHTSSNWGSERDKVHLNELLRVPFPLPGNEFIAIDSRQILRQVAKKIDKVQEELNEIRDTLEKSAKNNSLFGDVNLKIEKEWNSKRNSIMALLQKDMEPLIYRYFGLTQQEIMLIEDTINVFEPSSTPTTWSATNALTLDPIDRARIAPYKGQGLKAYAEALMTTLNTWAKAEGSAYRVSAEGATDDKTGLAMITINTSHDRSAYQETTSKRHIFSVLKQFYRNIANRQGTILYERDIFFFHRHRIYIIRPSILLNWTRTAAINDAARIYGEIALTERGNNGK